MQNACVILFSTYEDQMCSQAQKEEGKYPKCEDVLVYLEFTVYS